MAVPIKIVLYVADSATATRAAEAAFARIRALNAIMSDYDETSELRRLCTTAGEGKAVPVSDELWKVLAHAQTLSARVGRGIRRDGRAGGPAVAASAAAEGNAPGRDDRGGPAAGGLSPGSARSPAARGRAAQAGHAARPGRHRQGLRAGRGPDGADAQGVTRAMLDAGGDIRLGDPPPGQPGWRIGLTPLEANARATSYLVASRVAVATSGDAIQFVEIGGRRYSHIVDPRTGIGLTDHSRVTVVAPDGITADGLSTAVSVLGPEQGLKLIDKTPGTAAMILRAPQGKVERYESKRWQELTVIAAKGG